MSPPSSKWEATTSAGVLAAATPDEAAAALERGDLPPGPSPEEETVPAPVARSAPQPERGRLSWRSQRLRFVTVAMLALVLVTGYAVTQLLPTAEITLGGMYAGHVLDAVRLKPREGHWQDSCDFVADLRVALSVANVLCEQNQAGCSQDLDKAAQEVARSGEYDLDAKGQCHRH